ncbi:hypothetical protein K438DRAFT_1761582 [Mycena galopus ATCC 62051]|nr:hypothetical protein K438DRAFT_1761582 [Mycena galopus ATCC 62051]
MCDRQTRRQCGKAPSSVRTVKMQLAKNMSNIQKNRASRGNEKGASPGAGMNFVAGQVNRQQRANGENRAKENLGDVPGVCMLGWPRVPGQEEYKRAQYSKVANGDDSINCELCGAIEMFLHAEACISNIKAVRYHSAEELDRRSSYYEKSCLKGSTSGAAILAYQRQFGAIGGAGYVDKTKQSMTVKRQSQEGYCEQRGANVAGGRTALMGMQASKLRSTPFQRSTVVLEGELDEQFPDGEGSTYVVVKMSFIAKGRFWREKIIVDALHTADVQPAPAYAPKILAAFAAHDLPPPGPPNDSEILRNRKGPASALEALPAMVPRHLEIMAFDSPPEARNLKDVPSAAEFLAAAEDLFRAICDAFRRRVLHRDISVNNIVVADNQLLIVDWEIGRRFQEPPSAAGRGTITGTLDTMSMASLANRDPLPHDDIESAVYVLLKVLTQAFVPPVNLQHKWAATLHRYCWDDPDVKPSMLSDLRLSMWVGRNFEGSTIGTTVQIFRSAGHAICAQLVLSLLSLPLPFQRNLIDSSDYDAVLLSLQGLVEEAVAAVRSVDASSLIWSSAKVVDSGQEEI